MKIFLISQFNSNYQDIYECIKQIVLFSGKNTILRVDSITTSEKVTLHILEIIKTADLIIVDFSDKSPNVMYELGFAAGFNKPILPICELGESIPFEIDSFRPLIYDRKRLTETLSKPLRNFIANRNFPTIVYDFHNIEPKEKRIKTVFICYSHTDINFLKRLQMHLKPFEKIGQIDLWADTKIKAGEKWKEVIENALTKASIAVLLISADFLASDFILENELPPILKLAEEKGTVILPVILKPCRFSSHSTLSQFQAVNDPKKPLSNLNENDVEEVYVKIAEYIDNSTKI
jgi:hypothetical protein